jgi:hypothetical protein
MKVKFVTSSHHLASTMNEWLTPAYPKWFKDIRSMIDYKERRHKKTVKTCPAFVHLFKNSYLLRAPQDFMLRFTDKRVIDHQQPNEQKLVSVHSFDFKDTMSIDWRNILSVKVDIAGLFIPERSTSCLFFDPQYHIQENRIPLRVMTGVWPMHPNIHSNIGINMMGDRSKFDKDGIITVNRGDPLAYLYWPEGKPTIEAEVVSIERYNTEFTYVREHFIGDFLKKEARLMKEKNDE